MSAFADMASDSGRAVTLVDILDVVDRLVGGHPLEPEQATWLVGHIQGNLATGACLVPLQQRRWYRYRLRNIHIRLAAEAVLASAPSAVAQRLSDRIAAFVRVWSRIRDGHLQPRDEVERRLAEARRYGHLPATAKAIEAILADDVVAELLEKSDRAFFQGRVLQSTHHQGSDRHA